MKIGKTNAVDMFYGRLECDHNFIVDIESPKSNLYPDSFFNDVIRFFKCRTCSMLYQATRSVSKTQNEMCTVFEIINDDESRRIYDLPSCAERIMKKVLE